MSKIKISTDSTSDIPASFREELNISVLPLTILHEGKELPQGQSEGLRVESEELRVEN